MQKLGHNELFFPQSFNNMFNDSDSDDERPLRSSTRQVRICSDDEEGDFFTQDDDGFSSHNSSRRSSICSLENMHIQLASAKFNVQPPSLQHTVSSGYNSQESWDCVDSDDDNDVVEFIRDGQDYNSSDEYSEDESEDEAVQPHTKASPPQTLPLPKFSENDLDEALRYYQFNGVKEHRKDNTPLYNEQDDDGEGLEQGISRTIVERFVSDSGRSNFVRRKRETSFKTFQPAFVHRNEFANELKIHTSLNHRNIAHCYGCNYSLEQNTITLSLFVEDAGSQLNDYMVNLKKQGADEAACTDQLVSFAVQLCQALIYLKGQSVVHRDIKPANIGVREGNLKLFDFEDAVNLTQDSADKPAGTPYFSAPEITLNEHEKTDLYKCDWYSAGLTLAFAGYQADLLDRPTRMENGENSKMVCSITPYNSSTTNPKTLSLIDVLRGMTHPNPARRMPPEQVLEILSAYKAKAA